MTAKNQYMILLSTMKVKGNDKFSLNVGDAIEPISPINRLMYSKSTADAEWTFAKEAISNSQLSSKLYY